VVADPLGANAPGAPAVLDWDETLAFRRHLWSYGFGVAEAMDTAQRGMGLDWEATRELIERSSAEARASGADRRRRRAPITSPVSSPTSDEVVAAYERPGRGRRGRRRPPHPDGQPPAGRRRAGPDDYRSVYGKLLGAGRDAGDPALARDPCSTRPSRATGVRRTSVPPPHLPGARARARRPASTASRSPCSTLDHEVELRRALPDGVRLYTGDDFNYPS
jgi:hypothetical protein